MVLTGIDYAVKNGYIPVVDMQSIPNMYIEQEDVGLKNSWEFFFAQPAGYTLDDIKNSKNVYVTNQVFFSCLIFGENYEKLCDVETLKYWRDITRKYIKVNADILEKAEKNFNDFFSKNDKVLGVFLRGTDYVKLSPKDHPIQPGIEIVMEDVAKAMANLGCNKIFLATEDKQIFDKFRERFGYIVQISQQDFIEYKDGFLANCKVSRMNDKYLRGKEYLIAILMLSKCRFLISSIAGGSLGCAMMVQDWDYVHFYNLGKY